MKKLIVDTSDTYYLNDIKNDVNTLVEMHNNILEKQIIGKSVEGKEIFTLKISKKSDKKKPAILFTAGIHAREDFSVMLVMKMIDYIAYHYNKNLPWEEKNIKDIVDKIDLYFVPVVNPDGLNIVHNGIKASKNYDKIKYMPIIGNEEEYWKANSNGVDINKNFDDGNWYIRKSKPEMSEPCSEGFKGNEPNSEPETKALVKLCDDIDFIMTVSYHCSGNCTFWADSGTHDAFEGIDEELINKISDKFIYRKTKISQDPSWYGCGFENYFRARYQRPGLCIELSPYNGGPKQHPDSMFDELVWDYAKMTSLFFAEEALNIKDRMYNVYINDKFNKTFYSKENSIKYANKIKKDNIVIMHRNNIIWSDIEKYAAVAKNDDIF